MDIGIYIIEKERVYKHLDRIDLSHEFDLFDYKPILSEFLGYIEKKYPYKTDHVDKISDILNINEFAEYIEDRYSCFKVNSYDITVYNIIKE